MHGVEKPTLEGLGDHHSQPRSLAGVCRNSLDSPFLVLRGTASCRRAARQLVLRDPTVRVETDGVDGAEFQLGPKRFARTFPNRVCSS